MFRGIGEPVCLVSRVRAGAEWERLDVGFEVGVLRRYDWGGGGREGSGAGGGIRYGFGHVRRWMWCRRKTRVQASAGRRGTNC